MNSKNTELLTIKQLSNHVKLSVATINRMLVERTIIQPTYLVGKHCKRLWLLEDINNWLISSCSNPRKEG